MNQDKIPPTNLCKHNRNFLQVFRGKSTERMIYVTLLLHPLLYGTVNSAYASVCQHLSSRKLLNEFYLNFVFKYYNKVSRANLIIDNFDETDLQN